MYLFKMDAPRPSQLFTVDEVRATLEDSNDWCHYLVEKSFHLSVNVTSHYRKSTARELCAKTWTRLDLTQYDYCPGGDGASDIELVGV